MDLCKRLPYPTLYTLLHIYYILLYHSIWQKWYYILERINLFVMALFNWFSGSMISFKKKILQEQFMVGGFSIKGFTVNNIYINMQYAYMV